MSTMLTRGGRMVDLLNVKPEDIDLADIAWALAHTCRFMGHPRRHYSVAEHSINVARLLPEPIKIYGLLHDAHEAYIGDISTPTKRALALGLDVLLTNWGSEDPDLGVVDAFNKTLAAVERHIIEAIHEKLGVAWPVSPHVMAAVKYADVTMGEWELRQLFDGYRVPEGELSTLPMPSWNILDLPDAPNKTVCQAFCLNVHLAKALAAGVPLEEVQEFAATTVATW